MRKKIILLCTTIAAIVLELLPYGAVCVFANPDGEPLRRTFAYFDPLPFGYANFAPLIVALLTCVLLLLIVVSLVTKKELRLPILGVSAMATVLSLAPLLLGICFFSLVGALIFLVLMGTTCVALVKPSDRGSRTDDSEMQ